MAKGNQPTAESLAEIPEIDFGTAKIIRRGPKGRRFPLRVLREAVGKTQAQVALAADMEQSEISRVESRDDMLLSTLRRYARALGAELELVAVTKTGHRLRLDIGEPRDV
jgi:hypothetical protein